MKFIEYAAQFYKDQYDYIYAHEDYMRKFTPIEPCEKAIFGDEWRKGFLTYFTDYQNDILTSDREIVAYYRMTDTLEKEIKKYLLAAKVIDSMNDMTLSPYNLDTVEECYSQLNNDPLAVIDYLSDLLLEN